MELKIYVGKSNVRGPLATCAKAHLLDTLTGSGVREAISQSLTVVRILDAEGNELAREWYDAATEHEDGNDWISIAERLASSVA